MTHSPTIVAVAALDALGIRSTRGLASSWETLGLTGPGDPRAYRRLFGEADPTYRRLDPLTRTLVLAAQACGLDGLLPEAAREETGLVVETTHGCLEVDQRYARSLAEGVAHGAIFPYTLQSTCLGDLALRFALRGPTLSLSIAPGGEGEALREALRLLRSGTTRFVIAGVADVPPAPPLEAEAPARTVVALLSTASVSEHPRIALPEATSDPFSSLAQLCASVQRDDAKSSDTDPETR